MQVLRSAICGLCYGVRRARDLAEKSRQELACPVYTLGPLMHNPQEVARLASLGIEPRQRLEDCRGGAALIRTHGIARSAYEQARLLGVRLIDAVCPYVKAPQRLLEKLGGEQFTVILLGDRGHPEVAALESFAAGPVHVVAGPEEIPDLGRETAVALLSQTTQSPELFRAMEAACRRRFESFQSHDTICQDTVQRQAEALKLAERVDLLLVIGGRNSANTTRLFSLCRHKLPRTCHIESAAELSHIDFSGVQRAGLVSGASTPEWIIAGVEQALRQL